MEKVKCPYCGAGSSVWKEESARAKGLWIKCKKCGREFEIKIEK